MRLTISMDNAKVHQLLGEETTGKDFRDFCKDAIIKELWKRQLQKKGDEDG